MKKNLVLLVVLTFIVSFLFLGISCKGEAVPAEEVATEEEAAPAEEITEKPITVYFWCNAGGPNDLWQEWKKMYESDHPNVTIDITAHEFAAYHDIADSSVASGKENLDFLFFWGPTQSDIWYENGFIMDLTPYNDKYGWSDNLTSGAEFYKTEGKLIYFVTNWSVMPVFFYHKSIFTEAGVSPPETLEEFFTINEKIDAIGYDTCTISAKDAWPVSNVFNVLLARFAGKDGADEYNNWERDPDRTAEGAAEIYLSEPVKEAFKYLERMIKEGFFQEGANAMDDMTARQYFLDNKAAIYSGGMWNIDQWVKDGADMSDIDYFQLPAYEGNTAFTTYYDGVQVLSGIDEEKIPVIVDILTQIRTKEYSLVPFTTGHMSVNASLTNEEVESIAHPLTVRIREDILKNGEIGCIDAICSSARAGKHNELLRRLFDGLIDYEGAAQEVYEAALSTLD